MKILPLAAIIALLTSCVSHQTDHNLAPLQTVAKVDLERYVGLWYEIALPE